MSFPKGGNNRLRSKRLAAAVAAALREALGDTHQAIKTVMKWTGASERAVKNWFAGVTAPSGEHLVELVAESEAVLKAVLTLARRGDVIEAKAMMESDGKLAAMLAMVSRLTGANADRPADAQHVTPRARESSQHGPVSDPVSGPANGPLSWRMPPYLNKRQRWFLDQVASGGRVKAADLRARWTVSERTAKRDISGLKHQRLVEFVGARKTGVYRLGLSSAGLMPG